MALAVDTAQPGGGGGGSGASHLGRPAGPPLPSLRVALKILNVGEADAGRQVRSSAKDPYPNVII